MPRPEIVVSGDRTVMEPDDLVTRESGEWIKRKHHFLRRYCDMFTVSMRGKWPRLVYMDMLAGPGVCRIRTTGELLPGSPLIALDYNFDNYLFFEDDEECADTLQKRVSLHSKASLCQIHRMRWQAAILDGVLRFPNGLILAFIDPTGIAQVPWNAIQKLVSQGRSIDILMTIQHGMGISLNKHQYLAKDDETAVDAFLGDNSWRTKYQGTKSFRQAILDEYTEKMRSLGFETRKWQIVKNDSGNGLYYCCLFSRNPLALKFWDEVILKDEQGQRSLDL